MINLLTTELMLAPEPLFPPQTHGFKSLKCWAVHGSSQQIDDWE